MDDLKPFVHGEEGTHSVCDKHNVGMKSLCCQCEKKDCENTVNPAFLKTDEREIKQKTI